MPEGNLRRNALIVLGLIFALGAIPIRADVFVNVTMFSLAPNPVNILTGEAVFWTDADGCGPYSIYANNGAWNTVTDAGGIQFPQAGVYAYYDDNGNTGTINVTANVPPSVTITNPANAAAFSAPADFSFAVTASDTDADGLWYVEFYVGTNLVDALFGEPFATAVTNLPPGSYTLTAIAYDNASATATNSISISVAATPPPALEAQQAGTQIVITWKTNNAAGLILQSSTNLANPSWQATKNPVLIGSRLVVTNPIAGARRFFRLSNH